MRVLLGRCQRRRSQAGLSPKAGRRRIRFKGHLSAAPKGRPSSGPLGAEPGRWLDVCLLVVLLARCGAVGPPRPVFPRRFVTRPPPLAGKGLSSSNRTAAFRADHELGRNQGDRHFWLGGAARAGVHEFIAQSFSAPFRFYEAVVGRPVQGTRGDPLGVRFPRRRRADVGRPWRPIPSDQAVHGRRRRW